MKKIFSVFVLCFVIAACGGGRNPDKSIVESAKDIAGTSYSELGGGRLLMTQALSEVAEGFNFEIGFVLADGGSVTLVSFASSQLLNGFEIKFSRTGTKLNVLATAQGEHQDWSVMFANVDASKYVHLNMDIHNDESPAHVMIWQGAKSPSQNHTNTLYNSAEDSIDLNYDASPGNGLGRAWGFVLNDAQLLNANLSTPQDGH